MRPQADAIWNRATSPAQQKVLRAGDIALADMVRLHGLIMNGGVQHALEHSDGDEWARGISGYQFFRLLPVAALLLRAASKPSVTDMESMLDDIDGEYTSLVPTDQALESVFHQVLDERPELFAPVADQYFCPVCGYPGLYEASWSDDSGSFEICPSCGTEFGYDDAAGGDLARRQVIHTRLREEWRKSGCRWWSSGRLPPQDWDPEEQLKGIEG
jgi:hypothetical protein